MARASRKYVSFCASNSKNMHESGYGSAWHLSYDWLAGLLGIAIDSQRCPLTFSESTLKEFKRGKEAS